MGLVGVTSKNNFDISVIIPAFCADKFIHRAIDSVLSQTILPNELIVIDDGSTDNTLDILQGYKNQIRNIEVIVLSQENRGAGAARNLGLKRARQTRRMTGNNDPASIGRN